MTTTKEFYEEKLSWGDRITSVIDKPHSEIDQYILERNPSLEFDDDGKIIIEKIYGEAEEVRMDSSPYDDYYKCIKSTFSFAEDGIETFCDIGCATGHLVYNMVNDTNACGVDYFQYHKDHADDVVKDAINVMDIRDSIDDDISFDLVNCTEIAEHVDPKFLDVFLDNLKKVTGKYLILTWSNTYPPEDAPPQHVSPLPPEDVKKLMEKWGFVLDEEKTNKFLTESKRYGNFYFWWRESLTIWKVA
jgi:hypothetical protein|tara:strand:+ start:442 stop:1179 length:738 start_codon:yes stop_codon:yes gene_type:complete